MAMLTEKYHRLKCPHCGKGDSFRVDPETKCTYCHKCNTKGHLDKAGYETDIHYQPIRRPKQETLEDRILKAEATWNSLSEAKPEGPTHNYMESRGIRAPTWFSLGLREGNIWGRNAFACYPFRGVDGRVHCVHFTYINDQGKREKRYFGSKKTSFAMLKRSNPCIIAEGLENALIVRQELYGVNSGLLVAGDCGNMKNYADNFSKQLNDLQYIVIEDPDEAGEAAAHYFSAVFKTKRTIRTPSGHDAIDWIGDGEQPL
jgi:phage/plasmid primase-like uncharacterized protein